MKVIYEKSNYYIQKHFSENTLVYITITLLVLKRLHVHFTLIGGHRLKILDNGINGSETTVSAGYTVTR